MTALDWRSIFKRYVNIVGEQEGVTYLHDDEWTPEEWAAIEVARAEAYEEQATQ